MFQNNQRQVYRELNQEGERCDDDQPDGFWGYIRSELVDHNKDAKWLKDLQSEGKKYNQGKFEEDSR